MAKKNNTAKKNAYEILTEKVLAALEEGIIPWERPWFGAEGGAWSHRQAGKGKKYSLLNCLCLSREGEYVTWTDLQNEGGSLKEGAEPEYIFWFSFVDRHDAEGNILKDDDGNAEKRPSFKYYRVYHISDTTLEQRWHKDDIPVGQTMTDKQRNEKSDKLLSDYWKREKINVCKDKASASAYYKPSADMIVVPYKTQFKDKALYYSTLFHETIHSTGHESRLNRESGIFGTQNYALEELVAEMGAAALMNEVGLKTKRSETNSVAYIQNWISVFKNKDNATLLAKAAGRADKAVKLIENIEESK